MAEPRPPASVVVEAAAPVVVWLPLWAAEVVMVVATDSVAVSVTVSVWEALLDEGLLEALPEAVRLALALELALPAVVEHMGMVSLKEPPIMLTRSVQTPRTDETSLEWDEYHFWTDVA